MFKEKYNMTDNNKVSKQKLIAALSPKSRQKLEEIRQKQNFKTIEEAYDYLVSFTKQK